MSAGTPNPPRAFRGPGLATSRTTQRPWFFPWCPWSSPCRQPQSRQLAVPQHGRKHSGDDPEGAAAEHTGTAALIITVDSGNGPRRGELFLHCGRNTALSYFLRRHSALEPVVCLTWVSYRSLLGRTNKRADYRHGQPPATSPGSTQTVALSAPAIVLSSIAVTPDPCNDHFRVQRPSNSSHRHLPVTLSTQNIDHGQSRGPLRTRRRLPSTVLGRAYRE